MSPAPEGTASLTTIEASGTMDTMPRSPALPAPPPPGPIPPGTTLALDVDTLWLDATHLAGGSPFRLLGLSPAGTALVRRWVAGAPLGEAPGHGMLARRLVDAGIAHPRLDGGPRTSDVTIVIPVRDRVDDLAALLPLLEGCRVVVVDDGSRDPEPLATVVARHGARLVRRERSGGPGVARNEGLATVTTAFACLLDSDCRPPTGFLDRLLPALGDPTVALVAPRITGGPSKRLLGRFEQACSPLDVGDREALVRPASRVTFVPSACMVLRTSLGSALFDDALVGGEDVDLVWRLVEAGWSVRLDPSVVVEHPARPTLGAWLGQRAFYGSTAAALADRHGDAVAPIGGSAFAVGACVALLLGQPALGVASVGVGTAILARRLEGTIEQPREAAARLMLRSTLVAGPTVARQLVRSYGPALLLAGLASRRVRRATLVAGLVGAAGRWWSADTDLGVLRFGSLSVLDDAAYGFGLWRGVLRRGRAGALRPRLSLLRRAPEGARGQVRR